MIPRSSVGVPRPHQRFVGGGFPQAADRQQSGAQYQAYASASSSDPGKAWELGRRQGKTPSSSSQQRQPEVKPVPLDVYSPSWSADAEKGTGPPILNTSLAAARGRPDVQFSSEVKVQKPRVVEAVGTPSSEGTDTDKQPDRNQLPPLPPRPGRLPPLGKRHQPLETKSSSIKHDAYLKPYTVEVPGDAPHLSQNKLVDFFPWSGGHSEDVLSEQTMKQGYYDKTQVSQNETNTARPTLWPIFKHKSGLQALSSLFVSVVEQKKSHGRITVASSFKPPPRVTLTDTKREAWLRDLANPAISLRRLSRTIPHGIRGRQLLEQCLNKNIPTARAVWLTKCVGANEIRAFKRKGTGATMTIGGEFKWVRDWTMHVEQFLDGVIRACGEKDWKLKMSYAIRLISHIYQEHLLDKDHFLDWLLISLEKCVPEKFPAWLFLVQIFWKEVVQTQKYGKRLSSILVEKLESLSNTIDQEIIGPLTKRVAQFTLSIMLSHPHCFLFPRKWQRYEVVLRKWVGPDETISAGVLKSLSRRNKRLSGPTSIAEASPSTRSPSRQLVSLLDAASGNVNVEALSHECLLAVKDRHQLVEKLLEWISSPFRRGKTRVFLGASLLRKWRDYGIDTDGFILSCLVKFGRTPGVEDENIYLLVAELVRSRSFSVGRYLQWLIARGALSKIQGPLAHSPCDVRLLAELPLHSLPMNIINLRTTLLLGAGDSTRREKDLLEEAKAVIISRIPDLSSEIQGFSSPYNFTAMSRTIKDEIGRWLLERTIHLIETRKNFSVGDQGLGNPSYLRDFEFLAIRGVLEEMDDFTRLGEILKIASRYGDPDLLSSVTDTLCLHYDIFSIIGCVGDCLHVLLSRKDVLKERHRLGKPFLTSLAQLSSLIPGQNLLCAQLKKEASQLESIVAAAAYSPVSDHVADILQSADSDISEEIEGMLNSGTSIDDHVYTRIVDALLARVEITSHSPDKKPEAFVILLGRMKDLKRTDFERLVQQWLQQFLLRNNRPSLLVVLTPLLVGDCLTLPAVLACFRRVVQTHQNSELQDDLGRLSMELLAFLVQPVDLRSSPSFDVYRLRLKQKEFLSKNSNDIFWIISTAGAASSRFIYDISSDTTIQDLLDHLLIQETDIVRKAIFQDQSESSPGICRMIEAKLGRMLSSDEHRISSNASYEAQIAAILEAANELSLPLYQLKLELILRGKANDGSAPESNALSTSLLAAIERATTGGSCIWTDLISTLNTDTIGTIRQKAEERLLSMVPSEDISSQSPDDMNLGRGHSYLSIVEATASCSPSSGSSTSISSIVEKFDCIYKRLITRVNENTKHPDLIYGTDQSIFKWLEILLRVVIIHKPTLLNAKVTNAEISRLLVVLCILLANISIYNSTLSEMIFDTAADVLDGCPEEVRLRCIRFFREKADDWRFRYLLGNEIRQMDSISVLQRGKVISQPFRRWEVLPEPTPNVGDNDTSLSLTLFQARKM